MSLGRDIALAGQKMAQRASEAVLEAQAKKDPKPKVRAGRKRPDNDTTFDTGVKYIVERHQADCRNPRWIASWHYGRLRVHIGAFPNMRSAAHALAWFSDRQVHELAGMTPAISNTFRGQELIGPHRMKWEIFMEQAERRKRKFWLQCRLYDCNRTYTNPGFTDEQKRNWTRQLEQLTRGKQQ